MTILKNFCIYFEAFLDNQMFDKADGAEEFDSKWNFLFKKEKNEEHLFNK